MKKTLLLCFIHGFKGGEDTFGPNYQFTEDLRQLVAKALPRVEVRVIVYPKYETRGDLHECVGRFRDWLLEKVIDLEVEAQTPSPTVDPSVRTILIGHSMGGIVAAETVKALTSDKPIPAEGSTSSGPPSPSLSSLMFPYIQGVLAFDTPFLGIAPGVVAHGAEGHYTAASAAFTQLSGLTGAIWGGSKAAAEADAAAAAGKKSPAPMAALPAPPPPVPDKKAADAAAAAAGGGGWARWGKMAMYAGAGAALAAGGAAAYLNREQIGSGWTWATSHLEFVGCLGRAEELRARVAYMARARRELAVGFGNLYTRLGRAALAKPNSAVGAVLPAHRTFCNLPARMAAGTSGDWKEAVNDMAADETAAHMSMFERNLNPGYDKLAGDATEMIASWLKNDWYDTSSAGKIEKP